MLTANDQGERSTAFGRSVRPPCSASASRRTHAACSMNSTLTESNGNMIPPPSARSRTPAFSSAVTSPCTALTSRPTRRAASRMDTGPMPHSALSNSHRLAVRTCQSNSGDANAMRADFSARPDFQAFTKPAIESLGERTSRITVFIVPPRNVCLKIGDELVWRCELVPALNITVVPMVAFANLVVVAQNTNVIYDVGQSILEGVMRTLHRIRDSP